MTEEIANRATDPNCAFCKIVAGEAGGTVVFESRDVLAFLPLKPATTGHTLVIPKNHVPDLWQLDPAAAGPLMETILLLGRAIRTALSPDGMNLISSAGTAASQTVFHLHLHVVPRWESDQIGNIWPPTEPWSADMKENVAELIRDALNELHGE